MFQRVRMLIVAAVAVAAAMALAAPPASAAESPVYSGRGWKAYTAKGIYSISPDPYTIVFASEAGRDRLSPYLKKVAAQITDVTGVQVTVSSTIVPGPRSSCSDQPRHEIRFHYKHRPVEGSWASISYPCHAAANGSAWGGNVYMNSQYWTVDNWFSSNDTTNAAKQANGVLHELGHIMGLAHVNYDRDGDGRIEDGECVRNSAGRRPVMCAPSGGYLTAANSGRYTAEFDEPGLEQMARNYYLRQESR
ncbi:M12 family metallo-peptidase [Streptomyces phytophilus]|uniref:M12 family metallo-peptidase n=1 Tax=Streptomyces phytophilus TaxID=722715 RepID=UPI0015F02DF6|nr:M12 family metallo-peptidase [Streptomyces phytophilus]